uniref:DUF3456 domain-containing protein n=1 Tax=Araucaria cunninghamii TaxID=56994 RepID=A0A0D6R9U7_ARACU
MKSMGRSMIAMLLLLRLCLLPTILCVEDKCAACRAIAVELETALSNEKPKNHLDMRHRLDSRGQREGKLIDYKVSELRVVELLDGLCEKMKDYTLVKPPSGKVNWIKVEDWESAVLSTEKQEAEAHSKDISTFCGRLLEQTEEELAEKIKSGTVSMGSVKDVLCQDLTKHCDPLKYQKFDEQEAYADLSVDHSEL